MSKPQKIIVNPEAKKINRIKAGNKADPTKQVMFVCKGLGLTVIVSNTGGIIESLNPDGSKRTTVVPEHKIDFYHSVSIKDKKKDFKGEKDYEKFIQQVEAMPIFGKDFYYHKNSVPKDPEETYDERSAIAERFMGIVRDQKRKLQEGIEKAKYFEKEAHPAEGVPNPVNPVTGEESPIGAHPGLEV